VSRDVRPLGSLARCHVRASFNPAMPDMSLTLAIDTVPPPRKTWSIRHTATSCISQVTVIPPDPGLQLPPASVGAEPSLTGDDMAPSRSERRWYRGSDE
jgi:hypothetical protein